MGYQINANARLILPRAHGQLVFGVDNQTDPDHIGFVQPSSAIVAEARNGASDLAQGHGQIQGPNLLGAVTVNLDVLVTGHDPVRRANLFDRWYQIGYGLDADLILEWEEANDPEPRQIRGLRVLSLPSPKHADGPNKELHLFASAPWPFIVSRRVATYTREGQLGSFKLTNLGNAPAPVIFYAWGPFDSITITKVDDGASMTVAEPTAAGEHILIDSRTGAVLKNGVANAAGSVDLNASDLMYVEGPGQATFEFTTTGGGAGTQLRGDLRHHWWPS